MTCSSEAGTEVDFSPDLNAMIESEMLRFEIQELRAKNQALEDEVRILRRFSQLVERGAQIVKAMPAAIRRTT